jgi:hypothetical protein
VVGGWYLLDVKEVLMPKLARHLELELYRQPERIHDWKALPETV